MRVLELLARIPGTLLPFAVGLSLVSLAGVSWWTALAGGVWAFVGYLLSPVLGQLAVKWWGSWRNLLLGQAVAYVVLVVLLLAAAEQQRPWLVLPLSLLGGAVAPAERACAPNSRLDRSALGLSVLVATVSGFSGAWSVPLAACGVAAAAAVPALVMRRYRVSSDEPE
ncbi:hypothetical protein [Nesterenkonia natronophila]|uniref:MFS transporter n=1 Tax=Nesterenkonia natronophila TaxID=2174932 RepID=A0A3A4FY92_9MICC|nr:hypothetical protein [Nesterenkonia natronophila]RJN31029.1 hypothetical protein D3250_09125 [Nesterenkonia natronophila]